MIISRTPLRVTLGGGGSDLPAYYRRRGGGFVLSAAITKYVYVAVHDNFDGDVLLNYAMIERTEDAAGVRHPLLREALLHTGIDRGVEVSSIADIPAGTGLGSSGSFTVGLLNALLAYQRRFCSNLELAEQACTVEMDRAHRAVGKQDQYIAAVGGVTAFEFRADDSVVVSSAPLTDDVRVALDENLLLFFTGVRRSAAVELSAHTSVDSSSVAENLDSVRESGRDAYTALATSDLERFGRLLTHQWRLKLNRARTAVHQQIDEAICAGVGAGAAGGKLVGAGGGGFLLFYAEEKEALRRAMHEREMREVRFRLSHLGSTVVVDD